MGSIQRVELSAKGSANCHKLEDITNKSQCTDKTMPRPKDISPVMSCTDGDTASLEDFDLGKRNSHSTSISEHSLPTGKENHSLSSPPSNPVLFPGTKMG